MNKDEIETLLKKGILGFLENENENKTMQVEAEEDIEKILSTSTRTMNYSLSSKGACSFSKLTYVSKHTDQEMQIEDPLFWQKALANVEDSAL